MPFGRKKSMVRSSDLERDMIRLESGHDLFPIITHVDGIGLCNQIDKEVETTESYVCSIYLHDFLHFS